ncbi:MAG: tetratricopeptide repeat protein [Deltaproteobacteria bacterium]|nr:tetratricopeptide repeat protein [Deltaproteobacteria bacterium]MBN2674518.1 tetratricopeptide repeat protein [Deltaproteobacteria bacterium]
MNKHSVISNEDRLIHTSDAGKSLQSYGQETENAVDLEKSRQAVSRRISEMAVDRSPVPRRLIPVFAAAILIAAFGASAYLLFGPQPEAQVTTESAPSKTNHSATRARTQSNPPATIVKQALEEPDEPINTAEANTDRTAKSKNATVPIPQKIAEPAVAGPNPLQDQVMLFESAKSALQKGNCKETLQQLDTLARRYPGGILAVDATELRARCLFRQGRYVSSAQAVQTVIDRTPSPGKKAKLYRFMGDIQTRLGRCDQAAAAYRNALGLGLSATEEKLAREGMQSCLP